MLCTGIISKFAGYYSQESHGCLWWCISVSSLHRITNRLEGIDTEQTAATTSRLQSVNVGNDDAKEFAEE